ncbi:MAG TPA: hypothetical protein V6D47_02555 [Oscillatoriaceae cyanobacterium]
MKRLFHALAAALLLTGCQAAPELAPVPVAPQAAPPTSISRNAVRHLLDASPNDACMWTVTYAQSIPKVWNKYWEKWVDGSLTGSATLVGKGALITASYNRYVYRVPNDQVLVLHNVGGGGAISIDGYATSGSRELNFVYGPGEVLVFRFDPSWYTAGDVSGECMWDSCYTAYHGMSVEGITVNPSMLTGVTSMLASQAK